MKKLLFVLAFTFIGQQAFSQIYLMTISNRYDINQCAGISAYTASTISKITPAGVETHICFDPRIEMGALITLNSEINSIISQGYKLIHTDYGGYVNGGPSSSPYGYSINGLQNQGIINQGTTFYFAIPWTAIGLEEVSVNSTTLKSFIISPNPANTFVDISLDYSLKGESEVVFISEAGYISHKQSIGNISKNEKYNIDISKIPAGKYLVTIINGKTYTTPQKLIVL